MISIYLLYYFLGFLTGFGITAIYVLLRTKHLNWRIENAIQGTDSNKVGRGSAEGL